MKIRNVLVVYKKSMYQIYSSRKGREPFLRRLQRDGSLARLKASHGSHQRTLREVKRILTHANVRFRVIYRARPFGEAPYDCVVSVGGDGTLLQAARGVKNQPILGVNSDPERSVGKYCAATAKTFQSVLDRMLRGDERIMHLNRLQLKLNGRDLKINVANDVLLCHANPAAMSRYWLCVGRIKETHSGSGIWISTAAGSTAAMKSAGGKVLPLESRKFQYMPRELYRYPGVNYHLTGDILSPGTVLLLESLMRQGMLYIDGAHLRIPFRYGDVLEIRRSNSSLKIIM